MTIPAYGKGIICLTVVFIHATVATTAFSLFIGDASADEIRFSADTFETMAAAENAGWQRWFQREEISPAFGVARENGAGGAGSLSVSGNSNASSHGCWYIDIDGVTSGEYYRFEAIYSAFAVPHPRWQVVARVDWRKADGSRAGQPEYVGDSKDNAGARDGWRKVTGVFRAPGDSGKARIELYLGFCAQGTVLWDGITFESVPPPPKRMVRVATANCFPNNKLTSAESVSEFCRVADEAGRGGCDIVCLGEGVNLAGVRGASYSTVAEPIPGPTTLMLGEVARRHRMYIVAALGERDGHAIYNTGVLIDREGNVAGKYRKVQLPREEIEAGVTPGAAWPVFDTDFGRIGIMVCWDNQYAEPARALAIQGAEIIFMPIWGGNTILTQARAIENQVYVVSSGYSIASTIYDSWGALLAEAKDRPGISFTDIDLNETHPEPWLGDMRLRFYRELRTDLPVPGLNE